MCCGACAQELVAGSLRPRLFPFGKLSKLKSAAQLPISFPCSLKPSHSHSLFLFPVPFNPLPLTLYLFSLFPLTLLLSLLISFFPVPFNPLTLTPYLFSLFPLAYHSHSLSLFPVRLTLSHSLSISFPLNPHTLTLYLFFFFPLTSPLYLFSLFP